MKVSLQSDHKMSLLYIKAKLRALANENVGSLVKQKWVLPPCICLVCAAVHVEDVPSCTSAHHENLPLHITDAFTLELL